MQSYKSCIFRDIRKCEFRRDITFCNILRAALQQQNQLSFNKTCFLLLQSCLPCIYIYIIYLSQFFYILFLQYFFIPCGKSGSPYPGMAKQLQEQRYPFLSVCVIFLCVQTILWLAGGAIKVMLTQSDKMNIC